jgi:hypothetical protein
MHNEQGQKQAFCWWTHGLGRDCPVRRIDHDIPANTRLDSHFPLQHLCRDFVRYDASVELSRKSSHHFPGCRCIELQCMPDLST